MKICVELNLRTREVAKLFERRIKGDRLFIEAILHKIDKVIGHCRNQNVGALAKYQLMERCVADLTAHFTAEYEKFSKLLAKRSNDESIKYTVLGQFPQKIVVTNPLAMSLTEFFSVYDKLISIIKWLYQIDCFETNSAYFANVRRYQKIANKELSGLLLFFFTEKV
ncbi:AcaB family transcriptional regulator [Legionella sp. CNM-4043-24]|uniref:AcaB family transcriptional regulator n=1 Tax=Legionella sp. CNM-4043-24 TaxID=3421646 RepID=UPI00403A9557